MDMTSKVDTLKSTPADLYRVVLGCAAGTFFEYYDYGLINYFADEVADAFFAPTANANDSLLKVFLLFGSAYVVRPFGAIFFGWLSDTKGRRLTLFVTLLGMGLPTCLIACVPSYEMIGVSATILVFLLRIIQGLAVSGEFINAILFIFEECTRHNYGLYCFPLALLWTGGSGSLLTLFLKVTLDNVLTDTQMHAWGWRIPFLLGILIVLVGFLVRRGLPELHVHVRTKSDDNTLETGRKNVNAACTTTACTTTCTTGVEKSIGDKKDVSVEISNNSAISDVSDGVSETSEVCEDVRVLSVFEVFRVFWKDILLLTFASIMPGVCHTSAFYWLPDYLYYLHVDEPGENENRSSYVFAILAMFVALPCMCGVAFVLDKYCNFASNHELFLWATKRLSVFAILFAPMMMGMIYFTSNMYVLGVEQVLYAIGVMACVPAMQVWTVSYVKDEDVRARIATLPSNLGSIVTGFSGSVMTVAVRVKQVDGAVLAGMFVSVCGLMSTLALVHGDKYPYTTHTRVHGKSALDLSSGKECPKKIVGEDSKSESEDTEESGGSVSSVAEESVEAKCECQGV